MTSQTMRRTWPQRLTFGLVVLTAVACFATAAGLAVGQWVLSQRNLIVLDVPGRETERQRSVDVVLPGGVVMAAGDAPAEADDGVLLVEPDAANFLIVGADNNACLETSDPTIGDRTELGERSDTIMIWRANPAVDQLAVLSLPRDLYVKVPGGRKARINSTFRRNDPTELIATIDLNFGIPIDHYVQIDFCAFQRLVDAVGGVDVPFQYPARDRHSGLSIPIAGCIRLDGATALAYVRSRYYQYEDPPDSGNWVTDGTSDLGRINRQQDFLRRVVRKVVDEGLYSPRVASALITTNRDFVVTDAGLTVRRMLEFANTLRTIDPAGIMTYRIESEGDTLSSGDAVELPRIDGQNMRAVLDVFRGKATLASATEQQFDTATSTTVATADPSATSGGPPPASTLPEVVATENTVGVAPTRDITCP
ncbi:MAG TPA: LCP family protein [Ilumatobacter sp.]